MNRKATSWSDKSVSDAWDSRAYKYGIGENEKLIMGTIDKLHPTAVFEVGIGNGWPFAKHFCENGITVDGCDVSEDIVAKAKENLNTWGAATIKYTSATCVA